MDTRYEVVEERKLVRLASNGDKVAFGELYQRYVERIYNYCYYRMGNQQDAEDLTGRVFMKALGHIKKYDERGVPFSAWLYRIAHNLVANWHRDNGRHKVIAIDEYLVSRNPEDAPESMAEQSEEERQLMDAVRGLPEDRQQLLFLKFVEKLSNAEIGDLMNRTEGAIKSLYHRTLSTLYDDMVARGIENVKTFTAKRKKSQTN